MKMDQEQIDKLSDEELVVLALSDQENFLYLVNRYEKILLSYIHKISNIAYEEAEDILQEVFIKIYINLNGFDKNLKFSSWAYRITHNEVISNFRKKNIRPQNIDWDFDDNILNNISSDFDINQQLDNKYLRSNIIKTLNSMDIKYREVLILKYIEGRDYKEISDILKKPNGTVGTLINRAKKKFQKLYQEK